MCESHTVHNICGHVKIKTIVQCAELTDLLLKGALSHKIAEINGKPVEFAEFKEKTICTHQLCEDVSENLHIFPDMCDKCKSCGVVGDWMKKEPDAKFQVLRSWRAACRSTLQPGKPNDQHSKDTIDENNDSHSEDKELEFIPSVVVFDASTARSASQNSSSFARSVASSRTSNSTVPDLYAIKTRVAKLRARTDQLIAKIRAQKAATTNEASSLPKGGK